MNSNTNSQKQLEIPRSTSISSKSKPIICNNYCVDTEVVKKEVNPFYIKKSEKKLTVPEEPKLSTNSRASRRESIKREGSICDTESSRRYNEMKGRLSINNHC